MLCPRCFLLIFSSFDYNWIMKIGVLALQGDFIEHQHMLERLGVEVIQVRLPGQLDGLNGLIMPGGESTTIGKLAVAFHLMEPLQKFGSNMPSGAPVPEPSFYPMTRIVTSRCSSDGYLRGTECVWPPVG